jgi:hypothetical protein
MDDYTVLDLIKNGHNSGIQQNKMYHHPTLK